MKKVRIITHYYNSINYGGCLQAYALCYFLSKFKFEPEQISFSGFGFSLGFEKSGIHNFFRKLKGKNFFDKIYEIGWRIIQKIQVPKTNKYKSAEEKLGWKDKRQQAFYHFNQELIPHTQTVYTEETIASCVDDYDAFITGSDQVWNYTWYSPAYFLDFVPSTKTKLSYAASLGLDTLTEKQREAMRNSLKDYKAVSVREEKAVDLIKDLSPVQPVCVLDPTLLLERADWENIAKEYPITEKYVFCYFLGSNKKERKLAKQYAKKHGLKLLTIPHASGVVHLEDKGFGDYRLYDVSPEQFLWLVKNAECIFTDSFHAVVFSNIFEKQYFVFNRKSNGEMSGRITNITKLFNTENRFCTGKERENFSYIQSLPKIDYSIPNERLKQEKEYSIQFLLNNLK